MARHLFRGFEFPLLIFVFACHPDLRAQTYTIATIAGKSGASGFGGDGGPAANATFKGPGHLTLDQTGNLYISDVDNQRIREIASGTVTTVAGNGTATFSGDGGAPTAAGLWFPNGVVVDSSGNLYIADQNNSRIRKVSNGVITTVAGNGTAGFGGDGGTATAAKIYGPQGVAIDPSGNLYICDTGNNRIRKVSNGVITTVAGNGSIGFSGDGVTATIASLSQPEDVAVDSAGNIYIVDTNNNRIRKVSNGSITTVAGNGTLGFSGDGGPATAAQLSNPSSIALDAAGNIYIADQCRVRKVSNGVITTIAGTGPGGGNLADGIPGTSAYVCPAGLAVDSGGNVYISNSSFSNIRVLNPAAITTGPLRIPGGGGSSQLALSGGTVSVSYSQPLPVAGGQPPYTWSLLGGALPAGLSLSSTGPLSGVPSLPGGAVFTATVTDSAGASVSAVFGITVSPQPLILTTASPLPNGIVGSPYPPQVLTASGGSPPYTFQSTGALPGGLTLTNGQISGVPTTAGSFTLPLTVSDSSTPSQNSPAQLQLTVNPAHTDLLLSQTALAFSLTNGATGVAPASRIFVESNTPSQILSYSVAVSPAVPWLSVSGSGITPGAVSIGLTAQALQLSAGAQTSVVVTCITPSPCAGNVQKINVSVRIVTAPPQLAIAGSTLSFFASSANPQPVAQTLGLINAGGGTITVNSVTAANSYVTVAGIPATIAAGPATLLTVTVNPAGLAAGVYQSAILVNTSAGSLSVPLTIVVSGSATMTLSPGGTQLQTAAGSAPGNPGGLFKVSVTGTNTVNWTATLLPGASWLTLNTPSGSSTASNPGTVGFTVNSSAASLAPRTYYGAIQVASASVVDSPQTFIVVLSVTASGLLAAPVLAPAGLLFTAGASGVTPGQTVQLVASSATAQTYQASSDSSWISVTPATGSISSSSFASSGISVNTEGLSAGVYTGGVSYSLSDAAVRTVNVTLIVEAGATGPGDRSGPSSRASATCAAAHLVPAETGLVNTFAQSVAWPVPLTVVLVNDCGQPVTNAQIVALFSSGDPPLVLNVVDTVSGTYSATWTPSHTAQQATITVTATVSGFPPASVVLSGQVSPNLAPVLNAIGILNAFAIAAEPGVPLAPGTIIQIYGSNLASQTTTASAIPLPTSLNQTSVLIGGESAPLYYVSPGQINAQVPFELTAGNPYQVIVSANSALSTPQPVQLSVDSPGIAQFAAGQIIAQHPDNSLVLESSPAAPGEYLVTYVVGMGLTSQLVPSGAASPAANVVDTAILTLNGAPVGKVLYAGLTPTLVGLYQINFQVPADAPNGDLLLVLTQTSGVGTSAILPVHK